MNLYKSETYINDLDRTLRAVVNLQEIQGKEVLVTGATGTIGSFLVDVLMRFNAVDNAGITIYAAGRSIDRLSKRFDFIKNDMLRYIAYDVRKPVSFDFSVDYMIHAAGNAYPAAFNGDPVGTIMGNVTGTYALLEFGRMHGARRLLYVSSGEVYGQGDLSLEEYDEEYAGYLDSMSPRSCYPLSKRVTETLCASYSRQYGMETVIVRPCHTYGPGITEGDNRANVQFIRNVLDGKDIILKSAGTQMRSYCYIADCVSAVLTVLLNGENGEAYNSANPDARVTIAEFAQAAAEIAGKKVIFENPSAEELADQTPIAKQVLSSKKVEKLGWKGCFSLYEGVAHTIAALRGE